VQIADKKPRSLLNPMARGPSIARNVIGNIGHNADSNMRRHGGFPVGFVILLLFCFLMANRKYKNPYSLSPPG
jgi:hypothetical protein